jgi:hypothetical protein
LAEPATKVSAGEILADVDDIVLQVTRVTLKDAINSQAEAMLGRRGDPQGGKHDRRMVRVSYKGQEMDVSVPRVKLKDGQIRLPDLIQQLKEEDQKAVLEMVERAGSYRKAAKALGGRRGTSRSTLHRRDAPRREADLDYVMSRRFDPEEVVAVVMDGVAIGQKGKKNDQYNNLVAIGLTADGRTLLLGVVEAKRENKQQAERLVRSIVDRGVSDRVLFVTDGGEGMVLGIDEVCQAEPLRQRCIKHVMGNVLKDWLTEQYHAPVEHRNEIRDRLRDAWYKNAEPGIDLSDHESQPAEVALSRLQATVERLEELGYPKAAQSLRGSMRETVTATELGLSQEEQKRVRTNNAAERQNSVLRDQITRDNWRTATLENRQRPAWVASVLLRQEREVWNREDRVKELPGLRRLYEERIAPEKEAGLIRGPHLRLERFGVDTASEQEAARQAASLLRPSELTVTPRARDLMTKKARASRRSRASTAKAAEDPTALEAQPEPTTQARLIGSAEALSKLDLPQDADANEAVVATALRTWHEGKGKPARQAQTVTLGPIGDKDDPSRPKSEKGLLHLRYELTAPGDVAEAWRRADDAGRQQIEERLLTGAQVALETVGQGEFVTKKKQTVRIQGLAAVARVRARHEIVARNLAQAPGDRPELEPVAETKLAVEGFVVAAVNDKGKLVTPGYIDRGRARRRLGEEAAKGVLEPLRPIVERARAEQAAATRALEAADAGAAADQGRQRPRQDPIPEIDRRPREFWHRDRGQGTTEAEVASPGTEAERGPSEAPPEAGVEIDEPQEPARAKAAPAPPTPAEPRERGSPPTEQPRRDYRTRLAEQPPPTARELAQDRATVMAEVRRGDYRDRDPLTWQIRQTLGRQRSERIARRAHELSRTLPDRDDAWLRERHAEVSWAFERLPWYAERNALDQWMRDEGQDAAKLVALEREFVIRDQMKAIHAARSAARAREATAEMERPSAGDPTVQHVEPPGAGMAAIAEARPASPASSQAERASRATSGPRRARPELDPARHAERTRMRSEGTGREAEARAAVVAAMRSGDLKIEDPLDRHRESLGPYAERIAGRAHSYSEEQRLERRDERWLWRKVRSTHGALQEMPRALKEAREISALRRAHGGEVHSMFNRAMGAAPDPRDAIRQPDDTRALANPARAEIEGAKSSLARRAGAMSREQIDEREQAMRRDGRHPDQLEEPAAQWLAARRELEIRREMARQRSQETTQARSAERMMREVATPAPAVEMGGPGIGM